MADSFYRDGIRFECTGCGGCCVDHGDNIYVYLSESDVAAISRHLGLSHLHFFETYCESEDGYICLKSTGPACVFLHQADGVSRCRVYPVRPKQCATWPFWTENLNRNTWLSEIAPSCPGIGRGKRYTALAIEQIARERDEWYGR